MRGIIGSSSTTVSSDDHGKASPSEEEEGGASRSKPRRGAPAASRAEFRPAGSNPARATRHGDLAAAAEETTRDVLAVPRPHDLFQDHTSVPCPARRSMSWAS
ncbi:hypothetical protein PG991_013132 [Apiospora marii]|uniref:Uncharacterized protein n=1 Tax=Apiospora marii TaxID=335849 RepID=A0ABR1R524_9PEZI